MWDIASREQRRLELQDALDSAKSQAERNKLGQFATPINLATDILRLAKSYLPRTGAVRFLDPALGTGSFYSALLRCFSEHRIKSAVGYEIDPHYGNEAMKLWRETPLEFMLGDFTEALPPVKEVDKANLIVCNPPYVRHHHLGIEVKQRLRRASADASSVCLNGLAGLYCHFVCLTHAWMARNALAIWLIPSEFMAVNYGKPLKEYLRDRVTLLRIHRFDPDNVQFDDALVSSAVVCFRNTPPSPEHVVEFTYGGSLAEPEKVRNLTLTALCPESKWTGLAFAPDNSEDANLRPKLSDLFVIKRGIATGANKFFVLPQTKARKLGIPAKFLRPILPSPRFLRTEEINSDEAGNPLIAPRLFLLNCRLPEEEVRSKYPKLWKYLKSGMTKGIHERYICRHRSPWYAQEKRLPAPFLCTYMGRTGNGRGAFRFILNRSKAITANVYLLLYPKPGLAKILQETPELLEAVWTALSRISCDALTDVGRVYGGGLHKMEPRELGEAPLDTVLDVLPEVVVSKSHQLSLSW